MRKVVSILVMSVVLAWVGPASGQQAVDEDYTAKIREFTTESFFLTPLVDHLPASTVVPTPADILGHIAGAADVLSYPEEIYTYMRAVADASPRVKVFSIGETEEGREMILVVVSDEETIANLDDHKAVMARLSDPRITDAATAAELIETAKPIYWATGAIHSPETGSPEMLMELVYRLAVSEDPFIREIRDNLIFMTTPVIEVDGRAKVVDLHMAPRKDSLVNLPTRPLYWGKYVAHDNNRDGMGLSLKLSEHVVRTFLEYNPIVVHDLHESASHLYTSTGRGPYNAWIDPIVINEWNRLAYKEVKDMTAFGVPGVYTHDFYDGWAPNYMMWVAHTHNSIARFYETQGAGSGETRIIRSTVEREWHRPSTPLGQVVWSIRNNVNLQQSALLIALNEVASNRGEFLQNFYEKSVRSVAKARAEGPAAYVFPADDPRPAQQAALLSLLQRHGFEVQRADRDFEVEGTEYAEGSFIIRMDQPYSRGADMLLDRQYYNPDDPRPYDDVGWTLGPLFNVQTVRVEDTAVLDERMSLMTEPVRPEGRVRGSGDVYLIDYKAENTMVAFRFAYPELQMEAAEASFREDGRDFGAGAFVIPQEGNPSNLKRVLEAAAEEFGFVAYGSDFPDVGTHPLATPRVAVVHTWQNTQTEGWLRLGMDKYGVPYDYISVHEVRDDPNLIDSYDVLIFGPSSANALSVVRGVTGDEPIAWKASELTPNIGRQASTDDMRGGLELEGVLNLKRFVEQGGTYVAIGNSSSVPIHFGLAQGITIQSTPDMWARGGVFRTTKDDVQSPIGYGYGDELGVYFNTAPVFGGGRGRGRRGGRGGLGARGGEAAGGAGNTTARSTGRGGLGDEDIIQGRPRDMGVAGVDAFREANPDSDSAGQGGRGRRGAQASLPSGTRTVLRYSSNLEELLISGGLRNGQPLANSRALVDVPLGDGHVVLFSFNPFWRGQTLGSYALVFNVLMHHKNLDAGEPPVTQ